MKTEIKISEVLSLLEEGKTREEIRDYFDITKPDLVALFKHPLLKGKKAKKQRSFVVVDDVSTEEVEQISNVAVEEEVPTIQDFEETIEEVEQTPWNN